MIKEQLKFKMEKIIRIQKYAGKVRKRFFLKIFHHIISRDFSPFVFGRTPIHQLGLFLISRHCIGPRYFLKKVCFYVSWPFHFLERYGSKRRFIHQKPELVNKLFSKDSCLRDNQTKIIFTRLCSKRDQAVLLPKLFLHICLFD